MKRNLLIIVLLLIFGNCTQRNESNVLEINSNSNSNIPNSRKGVSKETAILIGKGFALFDYDFRDCNVEVIDENDKWKVIFSLKEPSVGGCPTFWIRKEDGEIVDAALPK